MRARINLDDWALEPAAIGAKFIVQEIDFGKEGAVTFRAHAAVIDWEVVRWQMMVLHGCAKIVPTKSSS